MIYIQLAYRRTERIEPQINHMLIGCSVETYSLSVVTGDKGYDSEENHLLVREDLHAFSIIPARYEHVPIWRTPGKYEKKSNATIPNYCTINETRMKP